MTAVLSRLTAYLEQREVAFRLIDHEAAASAEEYHSVLGTRYEQQAKALFVRYKKPGEKGFVVLALQAQKKADLNRVARLLNARETRLGTADQLLEATGCEYGQLPPFGRLFGLQLVLDRDLLSEEEIYFNAGTLTRSMVLAPNDLERVEEPILY